MAGAGLHRHVRLWLAVLLGLIIAIIPDAFSTDASINALTRWTGIGRWDSLWLAAAFSLLVGSATVLAAAVPLFCLYRLNVHLGLSRVRAAAWLVEFLRSAARVVVWIVLSAESVVAAYGLKLPFAWLWLALLWSGVMIARAWRRPQYRGLRRRELGADVRESALTAKIQARLSRLGIRIAGLEVLAVAVRTPVANAMVFGVGPNRRIAITDTLLELLNDDEIEAVLLHEAGHLFQHDPARNLVIRTAVLFAGFGAAFPLAAMSGPTPPDVAGLVPYAFAFVLVVVVLLAFHRLDRRRQELAADRFVYEILDETAVLKSALVKLHNCAMDSRNFDFGRTHPSLSKRLAYAESWRPKVDSHASGETV